MLLGTKFKRIISDEGPASKIPGNVKRVIFCTGKVYYELAKKRKQLGLEDKIAIVRIEQVNCAIISNLQFQLHYSTCTYSFNILGFNF